MAGPAFFQHWVDHPEWLVESPAPGDIRVCDCGIAPGVTVPSVFSAPKIADYRLSSSDLKIVAE